MKVSDCQPPIININHQPSIIQVYEYSNYLNINHHQSNINRMWILNQSDVNQSDTQSIGWD